MLKLKNITKSYGDLLALDNVSFEVEKGTVVGFLGPNAAGKTTTMRIITGFLNADEGEVSLGKFKLSKSRQKVAEQIGYLPENNPLYDQMRVDEYLLFASKVSGRLDKESLNTIAKQCGLDKMLTKNISQLSKGYKQRVGLAKALVNDPELLILDEPTEGLDPNQKEEILKLIRKYGKEHTILFSSHVLSEVSAVSDKVVIINEGRIVAEGEPKTLAKDHFAEAQITVKIEAAKDDIEKQFKKEKLITKFKCMSRGRPKFVQYLVDCTDADEAAVTIFDIAVKNKWKLSELHTEELGLEEVFKKLTKV